MSFLVILQVSDELIQSHHLVIVVFSKDGLWFKGSEYLSHDAVLVNEVSLIALQEVVLLHVVRVDVCLGLLLQL